MQRKEYHDGDLVLQLRTSRTHASCSFWAAVSAGLVAAAAHMQAHTCGWDGLQAGASSTFKESVCAVLWNAMEVQLHRL
jgi:hypothetical protein